MSLNLPRNQSSQRRTIGWHDLPGVSTLALPRSGLLESQRDSTCLIEIAPRSHRDRKAGFPKAGVIPGNAKLVPSNAEGSSDERFENLSVALLAGFSRQGSADPSADSRGHHVDVPVSKVLRAAGRVRRLSTHE